MMIVLQEAYQKQKDSELELANRKRAESDRELAEERSKNQGLAKQERDLLKLLQQTQEKVVEKSKSSSRAENNKQNYKQKLDEEEERRQVLEKVGATGYRGYTTLLTSRHVTQAISTVPFRKKAKDDGKTKKERRTTREEGKAYCRWRQSRRGGWTRRPPDGPAPRLRPPARRASRASSCSNRRCQAATGCLHSKTVSVCAATRVRVRVRSCVCVCAVVCVRTDAENVAEALGDDEGRALALAFEQGVGGDGGAHADPLDVRRVDAVLGDRLARHLRTRSCACISKRSNARVRCAACAVVSVRRTSSRMRRMPSRGASS